jgi:peptidyl-prolyl cis-trans isomerase C
MSDTWEVSDTFWQKCAKTTADIMKAGDADFFYTGWFMKKLWYIFGVLFITCQSAKLDDHTVALVNKERISKDDLIYSVEFFPQVASNKKGPEVLQAHLDLLIEKKMFAQFGRQQGFDRTSHVQQVADWVRRDEMIRLLYQQQIRDQVQISEPEIKIAFSQENRQIRLRHLFARTEVQAKRIKAELDYGSSFEEIARSTFADSVLREQGGDLGFVSFFDLDPSLAKVAFELPLKVISQPVRSRWGYHILRVDDQRQRIFSSQSELDQLREKLARELCRRKEQQLAGLFVTSFTDPLDIKMLNRTFDILAAQVKELVIAGDRLLPDYKPLMAGNEMELLSERLQSQGNIPLVLFKGGQWSLDDFFKKMAKQPLDRRPRIDTPDHLRHDIGVMIRDELLYQEALRRKLDQDPGVQAEVQKWQDEFTFSEWWQAVRDTIQVDTKTVADFYEAHSGRYIMPERVHVREILVATEKEAQQVLRQLHQGTDFAVLAKITSLRKNVAEQGGDLGLLQHNQFGNISLTAFLSKDGEIVGPVKAQGGFSVLQRLSYEPSRPMTLDEAKPFVQPQAREKKENENYSSYLKMLKQNAQIDLNEPLLQKMATELFSGRERVQMVGGKR